MPRPVHVDELAAYWQLVEDFAGYRDGFLPEDGGRRNQAHVFLEAVKVLDSELSEIERQMQEELEKKARANSGK